MQEEVVHYINFEPYVVYQWQDNWYKVPLFVLNEIFNEWASSRLDDGKILGDEYALIDWIVAARRGNFFRRPEPVLKLKQILKRELLNMEAYRLYSK